MHHKCGADFVTPNEVLLISRLFRFLMAWVIKPLRIPAYPPKGVFLEGNPG